MYEAHAIVLRLHCFIVRGLASEVQQVIFSTSLTRGCEGFEMRLGLGYSQYACVAVFASPMIPSLGVVLLCRIVGAS